MVGEPEHPIDWIDPDEPERVQEVKRAWLKCNQPEKKTMWMWLQANC